MPGYVPKHAIVQFPCLLYLLEQPHFVPLSLSPITMVNSWHFSVKANSKQTVPSVVFLCSLFCMNVDRVLQVVSSKLNIAECFFLCLLQFCASRGRCVRRLTIWRERRVPQGRCRYFCCWVSVMIGCCSFYVNSPHRRTLGIHANLQRISYMIWMEIILPNTSTSGSDGRVFLYILVI